MIGKISKKIIFYNKTTSNMLLIFLTMAVLNIAIGTFQCIYNHGDLRLINSWGELMLNNPEIYTSIENSYGIRYSPNSLITMSPIFGFYLLKEKVVYLYLLLFFISLWVISAMIIKLCRKIEIDKQQLIILILLSASAATRISLNTGQIGIIFFALFLFSYGMSYRHPVLSGFLLAIAISKPQVGIFFLIYMLLQHRIFCSLIASLVHVLTHLVYCWINDLNIYRILINYINWQMDFKLAGWNLETKQINEYFSLDFAMFFKALKISNDIIIAATIFFTLLGAYLIYRYKEYANSQLAILCVFPLFLLYHRSYDFFLFWAMIPLLFLSNNGKFYTLVKTIVICSMLIPYLPTFGLFQINEIFRFVFYIFYFGLASFNIFAIIYFSEKELSNELH